MTTPKTKNQEKFALGDTVYIPSKDPRCETIYVIDSIKADLLFLYHPIKPATWVPDSEVRQSLY
jgi:hypothetical protein